MGLKVRRCGRRPRLEVRSNIDLGWYDGGVSLVDSDDDDSDGENDPEKLRVRVHFTDFKETEDEFWGLEILRSEHEIRKRVRLLSHQLQDKECDQVVPSMVVCANYKSSDGVESKYYDAVVTAVRKAAHRREDRDEICHCRFTIQWQEGPQTGTYATVNCPDISLIVEREVGSHPVVRALLDFARDYSVVTSVVSELATPEGITPGSKVFSQNACNREYEVSPQEELETVEIGDQESFELEIPEIEEFEEFQEFSSQEGFGEEKPEEENQEQQMREDRVEVIEVQEREGFREENLKVNDARISQTSEEENLEVKTEQGQGATTEERPEIEDVQEQKIVEMEFEEVQEQKIVGMEFEEVQEQKIVGMEFEENQNVEREGVREGEPEGEDELEAEYKYEERKQGADVIELDWEEELQVEKLMEEFDSHYRACEDSFLDLPGEIADHLRNFELVQDCLRKGILEIEKFLL